MSENGGTSPTGGDYFEYVLSSAVRQALMAHLQASPSSTRDLLDDAEYSDSAIYNALGDLEERGLIRRAADDRWQVTGLGQVLADWLAVADHTEALIRTDEAYWQNHDVSVIPHAFRQDLHLLDGCEIVRSSPTNPQTVQARVVDLLREAESVDVMSEVQHPQYAQAVEERAEITSPRLVFDADLIESPDAGRYRQPDAWADGVTLWVHECIEFTLSIIDDHLVLSLPTLDGTYDMYTEIIADGDALEWGQAVFDHYFAEAAALPDYLEGH